MQKLKILAVIFVLLSTGCVKQAKSVDEDTFMLEKLDAAKLVISQDISVLEQ